MALSDDELRTQTNLQIECQRLGKELVETKAQLEAVCEERKVWKQAAEGLGNNHLEGRIHLIAQCAAMIYATSIDWGSGKDPVADERNLNTSIHQANRLVHTVAMTKRIEQDEQRKQSTVPH